MSPAFLQICKKRGTETHQPGHIIPTVRLGGGSIILWACFSLAKTETLIRVDRKTVQAKHKGGGERDSNKLRLKVFN